MKIRSTCDRCGNPIDGTYMAAGVYCSEACADLAAAAPGPWEAEEEFRNLGPIRYWIRLGKSSNKLGPWYNRDEAEREAAARNRLAGIA